MPTNKPILVPVRGIVMRPVNDRLLARVANEFAAHRNGIADAYWNPRRERDIVDYLNLAFRGLQSKLLVGAMRVRAVKESWRARNDTGEIGHGGPLFRTPITRIGAID